MEFVCLSRIPLYQFLVLMVSIQTEINSCNYSWCYTDVQGLLLCLSLRNAAVSPIVIDLVTK